MNLYLVTAPHLELDWDQYRGFICAAESEQAARQTYPRPGQCVVIDGRWKDADGFTIREWENDIDKIHAELIGVAQEGTAAGVILASYRAG